MGRDRSAGDPGANRGPDGRVRDGVRDRVGCEDLALEPWRRPLDDGISDRARMLSPTSRSSRGLRHVDGPRRGDRLARLPAARAVGAAGVRAQRRGRLDLPTALSRALMAGAGVRGRGRLFHEPGSLRGGGPSDLSFLWAFESYRARSLWPAVFFHSFHNTVSPVVVPEVLRGRREQIVAWRERCAARRVLCGGQASGSSSGCGDGSSRGSRRVVRPRDWVIG